MKQAADTWKLPNGVNVPCIGFGTWQAEEGEETEKAILTALDAGYRHIDTAYFYKNERSVGTAVKKCGQRREELFITSKVWNDDHGYENTLNAFERSLVLLGLDYLDLYLIHWPVPAKYRAEYPIPMQETWRAMEELYRAGKIRAIGVSNFKPQHLEKLMETAEILPMVNQVEFHPFCYRKDILDWCRQRGILVEGWSPLGCGGLLGNPVLMETAERYQKSVAQICIRWCLQNNVLPLPKSLNPLHIKDNAEVFDFVLTPEDMEKLNSLEGGPKHDSDQISF